MGNRGAIVVCSGAKLLSARRTYRPMRIRMLIGLALVACGGGDDGAMSCAPGTAVACACTDGSAGAQVCGADGRLGACACAGQGGNGGGSGGVGGGGSGGGGGGFGGGGGGSGGGFGGGGGGGGSSSNDPLIHSFTASRTTLTESQSVTFAAVVAFPASATLPISARLLSDDGALLYGTFAANAQTGSFTLTLSWQQIDARQSIDFQSDQTRVFRAVFGDSAGHSASATVDVTLTCGGAPACRGACIVPTNPTPPPACGIQHVTSDQAMSCDAICALSQLTCVPDCHGDDMDLLVAGGWTYKASSGSTLHYWVDYCDQQLLSVITIDTTSYPLESIDCCCH
jgi:hypothetical protein